MFRHVVLVTFKPGITAEQRKAFRETIEALPRAFNGIRSFACGDNVGKGPNHHDFASVMDFDDEADFRAYLASPAHQAYVETFGRPMVERLAVVQHLL